MTIRFDLPPENPQPRLLWQAAQVLREGGLIALPTDACYVLAACVTEKAAVDRLRQIRMINNKHLLSLMCEDLTQLSVYAQVDNRQYRHQGNAAPALASVPENHWLAGAELGGNARRAQRTGPAAAGQQPDPAR